MTRTSMGGPLRRSPPKTAATGASNRAYLRDRVLAIHPILNRTHLNCREVVLSLAERRHFVEAAE
ncbi:MULTISPECIES: hypothetical protein [Sinorhizobium]|uniref:Uncharacterized protein n=2 Tax=Sinorhizobium TaxID=28105 RepID=A0A2S3YRK9_9HYPH|nr:MULTISPECIES: hypothetical protein [Sinorhizobium]ASY60144.1 hypothetical protein SS05631_b60520 [Sinorhizobium sp. CCBAU 05631]AUX80345.1 hypothetical protein NXT3_PC01189 [Sinorhizobium fredii]PDT43294.1 hypothetical protein CO656_00940 [Sinorhizobium sp. FG01]PDT52840.1 hypothetical protein CO664_10815 [Sinorhizobium sp. NG07B]POH29011.1 hypothetical protein ATY30_15310 [Sinorhizobium americanum]